MKKVLEHIPFEEPDDDAPENVEPEDIKKIVRKILRRLPRRPTRRIVKKVMKRTIRKYIKRHPEERIPQEPEDYIPYVLKKIKKVVRKTIRPRRPVSVTEIIKSYHENEPEDETPEGVTTEEIIEIVEEIKKIFKRKPRQTKVTVKETIIEVIEKYITRHPESKYCLLYTSPSPRDA